MFDIGTLAGHRCVCSAVAINDRGVILGAESEPDSGPVVWTPKPDGSYARSALAAAASTGVSAINARGVIAGWIDNHAAIWRPADPGHYAPLILDPVESAPSLAVAMNDRGVVAGEVEGRDGVFRAVVWRPTGSGLFETIPLPDPSGEKTYPRGVSTDGVVAGTSAAGTLRAHAVLWRPDGLGGYTAPEDLGSLPGGSMSDAYDMSIARQVVGWSETGSREAHATLWLPSKRQATRVVDLGRTFGQADSRATAINRHGLVVGELFDARLLTNRAVLWRIRKVKKRSSALPDEAI